MSQRGTPTTIRIAHIRDEVSIVTSVTTPSAFTVHHQVYQVGEYTGTSMIETFGYWFEEKGAIDSHDQWVEDNSPHIE